MTTMTNVTSIDILRSALLERNFSIEESRLCGKQYTLFTSPSGKSWLTKNAHVGYPFTTAAIREISRNKALAYELATSIGVNVPFTTKVESGIEEHELRALLNKAPLVVKPASA